MDTSAALPLLDDTLLATSRYLQALTLLDDESADRPSVLPGWSRAHVVAHLSRNADAFTRVLRQAGDGEPASMYAGQDARDADIEETVRRHDAAGLRADAEESAARFATAAATCETDPATPYTRVPGDTVRYALSTVVGRRRAEVEIHHADLDLGYRPTDWPADFARGMVGQRQEEMAALPRGCPSMVLSATDVDGLWKFGEGQGPEVRGAVGDLAWWLVGRGGGRGLTCSAGDLPVLDRWR